LLTSLDEIAPANRDTICARYQGEFHRIYRRHSPGEGYFIDGKAELRSALSSITNVTGLATRLVLI
jgi:hypothetical protein